MEIAIYKMKNESHEWVIQFFDSIDFFLSKTKQLNTIHDNKLGQQCIC